MDIHILGKWGLPVLNMDIRVVGVARSKYGFTYIRKGGFPEPKDGYICTYIREFLNMDIRVVGVT